MPFRPIIALVLLGACAPAPIVPSIQIVPDHSGLSAGPVEQRIDFGRAPEGVIAALDRELGSHQTLTLENCPLGIRQHLSWGGLVLSFSDERFVGWRQNGVGRGLVCSD